MPAQNCLKWKISARRIYNSEGKNKLISLFYNYKHIKEFFHLTSVIGVGSPSKACVSFLLKISNKKMYSLFFILFLSICLFFYKFCLNLLLSSRFQMLDLFTHNLKLK